MTGYLLAATPIHGHVGPLLRIGAYLVGRGHDVTMLTGHRFEDAVAGRGMRFLPLGGRADFDDREPDSYLPDRLRYRGIRRAQYEIRSIFIETIPDQARAIADAVSLLQPEAILVDGAFAGVLPMLSKPEPRPPVLGFGVTPLSQSDRDLAPYGMGLPPARTRVDRVRYAALGTVARKVLFRSVQRAAVRAVAESGARLHSSVMDASREFDLFLQTGPHGLEYPRHELSVNTRFVGVLPEEPAAAPLPDWWNDLDAGSPVVHVTQGTIDNQDFGRLVRPTLDALADRDVLVVVSTGGRDPQKLGRLPSNARAGRYLPYGELLPRTALVISNGGYGGVQAALAHGVPLVVAGDTEDKPEVAARIAWTGAGIDLHTGTPDRAAIADAADAVLRQPEYRAAAQRIAVDIASHDTLAEIESALQTTKRRR